MISSAVAVSRRFWTCQHPQASHTGLALFSSSSAALRSRSRNEKKALDVPRDKWNYNTNTFDENPSKEYASFKYVDANVLEKGTEPPRGVKMLARDFIEDSLYNPHYGYFPKQATIFDTKDTRFDYTSLRDSAEFQEEVGRRYAAYGADKHHGPGRQLWHTPTELFKPWYGRAIAQCLVSEYLLKYFPYEDFIIYEIGAGNGTLAMDILDYLRKEYPEVYDRTRYKIIEISGNLVKLQIQKLCKVHPCVDVQHRSVFHWKRREPAPCFFVAMEVIDNFAHDVVRYDLNTMQPYQGEVVIDNDGDFDMIYSSVTDPLISSFLEMRTNLGHPPSINKVLRDSQTLRKIYTSLPFAPNLSREEYIPTRLLSLLKTLRNYFPRHRLLLSDFSSLPDTIKGVNAPVVQTRFRNVTVPCSTLLVKQGYFDIFFPTNFEHLRDMYEHVLSQPQPIAQPNHDPLIPTRSTPLTSTTTPLSIGSDFFSSYHPSNRRRPLDGVSSASGLPVGERKSSVFTHSEFLETYADLSKTRLRNGENPMLDFYKNVKFLF
ncbi:S-adenosyl-L-methionine-dependent methyltransferase [Crucibulum laeve]|uniref:Protein arginine methyltransferase NDUFAF7 n=1 Tax=Crucibulum laeve TaxID=68775 RepID=A0A5C3M6B7_9AGAR|nr:S-adenosyl-L-methionine-dependent methyltransferase [Crucibulum laeve]